MQFDREVMLTTNGNVG